MFGYYNKIIKVNQLKWSIEMSVLQKLQEKIEQLKNGYEAIKSENVQLHARIESAGDSYAQQQKVIAGLQNDIAEKDKEIEAIIAKVEELLA
jgi:SMC interacting uncharacterized protein involved in chromosome segregation